MKKEQLPRGFRNNNPLNIRIGNVWLGEVEHPTDPSFEQFVSMQYGIRAACILLRRYIRHYKRTTIPQVISAWAPPSENATSRYVDIVCQLSGMTPDTQLNYSDKVQMCRLLAAMIQVENGRSLPMEIIEQGYNLA